MAPMTANGQPGRDEEPLRPSSGARRAAPHGLEHAHGGRPNGHDAAALRQRAVDRRGGLRRHRVGLGVERMVGQLVGRHGPEGVESDAQRHRDHLVAAAAAGRQAGVKCSPAVGAAADPGWRAYTVW